ncbi:hypothetical protein K450DRAFT_282004 [Umbelopsis ramanniana AG]|uniref:Uncharacterized protein n=1 Tax=Umbelopsis ramanniana AG TaxID=1314678 RepID=A0AAD5HBD8_UMBRA|nr:uncharacterized protein K450DRAFT_282004 [Umbelopsis ramanniana AG]KAI8578040.1 hypothetical protein K450DRAFT_282004 [Umbelopsis ramanniana AG]
MAIDLFPLDYDPMDVDNPIELGVPQCPVMGYEYCSDMELFPPSPVTLLRVPSPVPLRNCVSSASALSCIHAAAVRGRFSSSPSRGHRSSAAFFASSAPSSPFRLAAANDGADQQHRCPAIPLSRDNSSLMPSRRETMSPLVLEATHNPVNGSTAELAGSVEKYCKSILTQRQIPFTIFFALGKHIKLDSIYNRHMCLWLFTYSLQCAFYNT